LWSFTGAPLLPGVMSLNAPVSRMPAEREKPSGPPPGTGSGGAVLDERSRPLLGLEYDFDGAVELLLEDFVATRGLVQGQPVGAQVFHSEGIVIARD